MEHLEEGDEQHEDDDSERLPQRLQGNVLLLLPAQGFPENDCAIYILCIRKSRTLQTLAFYPWH